MIRKLFRRAPTVPQELPEAELARRLTDPDHARAVCGLTESPAAGAVDPEAPFGWKNPPPPGPDEDFELGGAEILTRNYARRDGDNLLRAYLPIPVKGTETQVFLGVWCSLKTGNHARFRSAQARGDADSLGDMFSWLYTQLPPPTGPVLTEGVIVPYSEGRRPLYWITTEKHPFYAYQQDGMSATEILSLYEAMGFGALVQQIKS